MGEGLLFEDRWRLSEQSHLSTPGIKRQWTRSPDSKQGAQALTTVPLASASGSSVANVAAGSRAWAGKGENIHQLVVAENKDETWLLELFRRDLRGLELFNQANMSRTREMLFLANVVVTLFYCSWPGQTKSIRHLIYVQSWILYLCS